MDSSSSSNNGRRFTLWVTFLVFSVVAMGASVQVKRDQDEVTSAAKYIVACSVLTVILTGIISLAHLFPVVGVMLVGNMIEGFLSLSLMAFWAAAVAIVTNTENNLATFDGNNTNSQLPRGEQASEVLNGNLYYFSWACFVTSIILFVNYVRSVFGIDVVEGFRNRGARLSHWAALIACSLVVAGSSARILNDKCGGANSMGTDFCRKTRFGISVGALGVFFSVAVVVMKMVIMSGPMVLEFITSLFLAILNAFGVGYLTASGAPGSAIGNLYYFSWASFLLAAYLTAENVRDVRDVDQEMTSGNGDGPNLQSKNGDIEVETIEDV